MENKKKEIKGKLPALIRPLVVNRLDTEGRLRSLQVSLGFTSPSEEQHRYWRWLLIGSLR